MNIIRECIFKSRDVDRKSWWDNGVGRNDNIAAAIYLALSLVPLFNYAFTGAGREWLDCPGWPRVGALLYGFIFVTAAPLLWLWIEASTFFDWSAKKYGIVQDALPSDPSERAAEIKGAETRLKEERDRFKLHSDSARSLWAAVIALYAGALLKFG